MSPAPLPAALYVHFPFCRRRCHYCDFAVTRSSRPPLEAWVRAIGAELDGRFSEFGWERGLPLDSVYVGGGTPSLLGAPGMEALAKVLRARFAIGPETEWTVEANPASLAPPACRAWRRLGIDRLSLGVQSFSDPALRWLGRLHDAETARRALRDARRAGFEKLNLDLIFGLPASVPRDWSAEIGQTVRLGAPHVSAYGLTAEPATPLGRAVGLGRVRMPSDERYAAEYLELSRRLGTAGFVHYEVSNFARPGGECRHNWHYWDASAYLGVGPSAHSFLGRRRFWNVRRWRAYRTAIESGASPDEGEERLDEASVRTEALWLGLRTRRGIRRGSAVGRRVAVAGDLLEAWEREGWLASTESGWRLTPAGWLRLDALVAALDARLEQQRTGAPAPVPGA